MTVGFHHKIRRSSYNVARDSQILSFCEGSEIGTVALQFFFNASMANLKGVKQEPEGSLLLKINGDLETDGTDERASSTMYSRLLE